VTVALIALPLVCAVLIGFLPLDRRVSAALGLAAVLAELVLAAVAIVTFNVGGGSQFVTDRVWIPNLIGGADVHFHVAMDGLSMFMVALTAVEVRAGGQPFILDETAGTTEFLRGLAGAELDEQFVIGEPDDVVRKVGPLIDAGLDCLIFNMPLSQPDAVARAGKLLTSTFS